MMSQTLGLHYAQGNLTHYFMLSDYYVSGAANEVNCCVRLSSVSVSTVGLSSL